MKMKTMEFKIQIDGFDEPTLYKQDESGNFWFLGFHDAWIKVVGTILINRKCVDIKETVEYKEAIRLKCESDNG